MTADQRRALALAVVKLDKAITRLDADAMHAATPYAREMFRDQRNTISQALLLVLEVLDHV